MQPNISDITEDLYLKLRVVVHYQKGNSYLYGGTHTSRGGYPHAVLLLYCTVKVAFWAFI